jgi:hypothetical protein
VDYVALDNNPEPVYDPFTSLAVAAVQTSRIRLGTMVAPLPRFKPWDFARNAASLDHLSHGRMILGIGLGDEESSGYSKFGEDADSRVLAEKLDESLEIITGLWTGRPFRHHGKHYRLSKMTFLPPPLQKPRIPIWLGGFWPRKKPFRRAAKWDGTIPGKVEGALEPGDLRIIREYIMDQRSKKADFDFVILGRTKGTKRQRRAKVAPFIEEGMTWWIESPYKERNSLRKMSSRIKQGPPK